MNILFYVILVNFLLVTTNNNMYEHSLKDLEEKLRFTENRLTSSEKITGEYREQNRIMMIRLEGMEKHIKQLQKPEELKQPDDRDEVIFDLEKNMLAYNKQFNEVYAQKEHFEALVKELNEKVVIMRSQLGKCMPMENANSMIKDHKEEIINLRNKIIALNKQLEDQNGVMNDLKTDIKGERILKADIEAQVENLKKNLEEERMVKADYEEQLTLDKKKILDLEFKLKENRMETANMKEAFEENKIITADFRKKLDDTKMKLTEAEELNREFLSSINDVDLV